MIKTLYYSSKIEKLISINKIKNIVNINPIILNIIYVFNKIRDNLITKTIYYFMFYYFIYIDADFVGINAFVLLSVVGGMNNTYLFKYTEIKKIIFDNYQVDSSFIVVKYYYDLLKYLILTLPYIIILVYLLELESIYIIFMCMFLLNIKTIFNIFFLKLYDKTNYIYNEDNPNKYIYILNIIIVMSLFITVILKINILNIIHIINVLGIFSHIFIIFYKNYDKLINGMSYSTYDFSIKDIIEVKESKIKENKLSYKYLNDIFDKRYNKHIFMNVIKSTLIGLLLIMIINKTKLLNNVIMLLYFTNINNKMIELYYYKCDRYLSDYIDKKIYYERKKSLIKYNLIITFIILIALSIKYNSYFIVPIGYLITFTFTNIYLVIYYILKPFNNKIRAFFYRLVNFIISIIMIFIDHIDINIYLCYLIIFFVNIILNTIRNKYICKVK